MKATTVGVQRCFTGKRWNAGAPLIIVNASLDSVGLNYFHIVVLRVRRFDVDYVKTEYDNEPQRPRKSKPA